MTIAAGTAIGTGTVPAVVAAAAGPGLTVSDRAARRIAELIAKEGNPALVLRLSVSGGGCSGFQYHFDFDATVNDEDRVIEQLGIRVAVDPSSLELLAGAELDFVEDLIGASFQIRNPNAVSSCGCGSSFAI